MAVQLKKNFTIIVTTVIIQNDRILMVQEAKRDSFGLWYLPAGRLEQHESLVEGAIRECKEETGLSADIIAVLSVEMHSSKWIRINFVGRVVGGELKKTADKESLAAEWVPKQIVLAGGNQKWPLRATDIVSVVQSFVSRDHWCVGIIPEIVAHNNVQLKLYLIEQNDLIIDTNTNGPPIIIADIGQLLDQIFSNFFRNNFAENIHLNRSKTILSIEFSGTPNRASTITDGIQFTILIPFTDRPQLLPSSSLVWADLTSVNRHPNMGRSTDLPLLIQIH